jgi:hypothetical protein
MEFVIWAETRLAGKTLELCPVASVERSASGIEPEELGLTLQDGKTVLKQIQAKMVHSQISILDTAFKLCRSCGREQRVKDLRSRQLRTVFGTIEVRCRRYTQCTCSGGKPSTLWPLGVVGLKRNTPELTFLLANWGSKVPYRRAAELLGEFLPISDAGVAYTTRPSSNLGGRCPPRPAGHRAGRIRPARITTPTCTNRATPNRRD